MERDEMDVLLHDVRSGKLSFDRFVALTKSRWAALSAKLIKRWDAPPWVAREDVEQDLIFSAWRMIWRSRELEDGKARLVDFVIWNATDKAKKAIHKARLGKRQHRDEDFAKSRYERNFSSFIKEGDDEDSNRIEDKRSSQPNQHESLVFRSELDDVRRTSASNCERIAVDALEITEGDVDAAVTCVLSSPKMSFAASWRDAQHVEQTVRHVATRIIGRLALSEDVRPGERAA